MQFDFLMHFEKVGIGCADVSRLMGRYQETLVKILCSLGALGSEWTIYFAGTSFHQFVWVSVAQCPSRIRATKASAFSGVDVF
ncbi:Uncharacterised protein [Legionella cherrii]|uniref:Uncharacterized protein n=1 Tax=Legionella cherrii TaxID=28084 RepID=A0A0W0S6V1_9GAMM|nr:hypothetical protein Lche_0837 [Legionella cherrii]VEB35671.1 Uncharacterised protein [Legionella cherrii]